MSTLNELGRKYGTDKSSFGKQGGPEGKGHDYLRSYEIFLEPRRESATRVLEIGVQKGASIRMWEEYFGNAKVYGLDIAPTALKTTGERIEVRLIDQSDAAALDAFASEVGPFDVIIEDGSHFWAHQIIGIRTLLRHVATGGVYIVEDLHTSYSADFGAPGQTTGVAFVLRCLEKIIGGSRVKDISEDAEIMELIAHRVDYATILRHATAFFMKPSF